MLFESIKTMSVMYLPFSLLTNFTLPQGILFGTGRSMKNSFFSMGRF